MRWDDRPYHSLDYELKRRFGRKVCGGFEAVLIFVPHEWQAESSVDKNAGGHKK